MIDKETVLAVLSTISAIGSGYMLYKSNISKDKTKTHIETLEAEGNFREELLENLFKLKEEIDKIYKENSKLRDDLYSAVVKIKDLELLLSEKINKCKVLENFLKYLTVPAWFLLSDSNDTLRFAFVNFSFCNYFEVSSEYCVGQEDYTFLGEDVNVSMLDISESVLNKKLGARRIISIKEKVWNILKFPIIEDGKIIGIGGILINCKEV